MVQNCNIEGGPPKRTRSIRLNGKCFETMISKLRGACEHSPSSHIPRELDAERYKGSQPMKYQGQELKTIDMTGEFLLHSRTVCPSHSVFCLPPFFLDMTLTHMTMISAVRGEHFGRKSVV